MEDQIVHALARLKHPVSHPGKIAECVVRMSDYYIAQPQSPTPWHEEWAQVAQIAYYLPLNYIRSLAVVSRGDEVGFFQDLDGYLEWGCGLSPTWAALRGRFASGTLVDKSPVALQIREKVWGREPNTNSFCGDLKSDSHRGEAQKELLVMSYVCTELSSLPQLNSEALLIIEPSTRDDGRRLQEQRDRLVKSGYSIWAPCVHQETCPLLAHSKSDWCHDRVHWSKPKWFSSVEQSLPFKNDTLTFSYLLARRKRPRVGTAPLGRLVGDALVEKGKTRQLFCRGSDREFLSLLHKKWGKDVLFPRGDLLKVGAHEKVSNELRPVESPETWSSVEDI